MKFVSISSMHRGSGKMAVVLKAIVASSFGRVWSNGVCVKERLSICAVRVGKAHDEIRFSLSWFFGDANFLAVSADSWFWNRACFCHDDLYAFRLLRCRHTRFPRSVFDNGILTLFGHEHCWLLRSCEVTYLCFLVGGDVLSGTPEQR